ncbi:MAG: copper resistance protein CopC [Candidatus Pristimantibacillus sp.]
MKRFFLICFTILWLIPGVASAHSKIDSSTPGSDETVTMSPTTIELSFNTTIEKLSNFKLLNETGEQVNIGKAVVDGSKMSGDVPENLANGTYTVKWTIIGDDGHTIDGNYSFIVDAAVPAATASPEATEAPEAPAATVAPTEQPQPTETAPAAVETDSDSDSSSNSSSTALIVIGAIIVVVAGVLIARRRKP